MGRRPGHHWLRSPCRWRTARKPLTAGTLIRRLRRRHAPRAGRYARTRNATCCLRQRPGTRPVAYASDPERDLSATPATSPTGVDGVADSTQVPNVCHKGELDFKRPEASGEPKTRKPPATGTDIGRGAPISSPVTRASAWGPGDPGEAAPCGAGGGPLPHAGPGGRPHAGERPRGNGRGEGGPCGGQGPGGMEGRGSPPS
jgi:hypothetical protein